MAYYLVSAIPRHGRMDDRTAWQQASSFGWSRSISEVIRTVLPADHTYTFPPDEGTLSQELQHTKLASPRRRELRLNWQGTFRDVINVRSYGQVRQSRNLVTIVPPPSSGGYNSHSGLFTTSRLVSVMATNIPPKLFPLYLAPIELFMELDDRPAYPMTFVIQLRLSGELDRAALETALAGALERHPFLAALVKKRKKNRLCWVSSEGLTPFFDWSDDGRPVACPGGREAIDLASEVGLRVWVRPSAAQTEVTLQFHHACCDGVGAYRFLGDWLALYGQLTVGAGVECPVLDPLDVTRLRTRSRGLFDPPTSGRYFRSSLSAIREGLGVLTAGATPLAPARDGGGRQLAPFPAVQSVTFDRAEHEQLREAAMRRGVMLNDVLLAELFCAARDWNERKTGRGGRKLRIMMPIDLRTIDDYETPASNKVSYTFLTRRAADLNRSEELLQSIRRETLAIKSERRGLRFASMLAAGFAVKGLMPLVLACPFCMATAILSNVGDPSRRFTARFPRRGGLIVCGNLVLVEVTGAPPLRTRSRATISVFAYNRRLTLSARCDPFSFTAGDTQEFLNIYADRLRQHPMTD